MSPEDASQASPRARILVVDDNHLVAATIHRYLTRKGFSVVTAENGDEAFLKFLTDGQFDLVLTDVKMPQMDGLLFYQMVKSVDEKTPVYVMSAYPDDERTKELLLWGVEGFLTKPFELPALDELLEKALKRD